MDSVKSSTAGKFGTQTQGAPLKTFGTGAGTTNATPVGGMQQGGLWGNQQHAPLQSGSGLGTQQQHLGTQQSLGGNEGVVRAGDSPSGFLPRANTSQQQFGGQNLGGQQGWQQQQQGLGQQEMGQQGWTGHQGLGGQQQQYGGQNLGQQQFGGQQQQQFGGQGQPNTASYEKPAILQRILHPRMIEEVQPVIQRQREMTQIKQVIAPIYQREEAPPTYTTRELPMETRPPIYNAPGEEFNRKYHFNLPQATTEYLPAETQRIVKPAIVKETIKRNIVEEIYPVVHREVIQPQIVRQTQNVFQRVVEPPTLMREERAPFVLSGACPPVGQGLSGQQGGMGGIQQGLGQQGGMGGMSQQGLGRQSSYGQQSMGGMGQQGGYSQQGMGQQRRF